MLVQSARGRALIRGRSGTAMSMVVGLKVGVGGEFVGTAAGYADVIS